MHKRSSGRTPRKCPPGSEGSGLGHSESDLKKACAGADVKKGLAIHGADVLKSEGMIRGWLF